MPTLACLNGELMPADQARVPIWDRGFLFGDSVYEVLRIYRGRCWLEDAHLARLRRSLGELAITNLDFDRLVARMRQTIAESKVEEGTVYIQITRGVAPRNHAFPGPEVPPTELIIARTYDDTETARLRREGVAAISYPDLRWQRCDIKTTNLLPNCIANQAAHAAGAYEAILINSDGHVSEATHSSVLWVRDGRLEGTPEGPHILPGTTRRDMLELARGAGISFQATEVTLDQLKQADEVLLTGTSIEVLPIVKIDDALIGDGRPGPLAVRLQAAYRQAVERWLALEPA
jgi:D-alanine transaminase